MLPAIRDGDILLVDRSQTTLSPTRVDTYVVLYSGEISIKKVKLSISENKITLMSENSDKEKYPNTHIVFSEMNQENETFNILGRVVWHAGEI